jgi:hypothetical protein
LAFTIDHCSLDESLFVMVMPEGFRASSEASLSVVSFPAMPGWLGIQYRVVFDPLDTRQLNMLLISAMQ